MNNPDGGLHQRLRDKASEIHVHPRYAGENTELDITLFKAIPVGVYEKTMGREVVKYTVEFKALPLTNNSTKGGNYFRIGNEL